MICASATTSRFSEGSGALRGLNGREGERARGRKKSIVSPSPFLPFPLSPFLPFLIALCWIILAPSARAQQAVPDLSGRVVDQAGILSDLAEETLTALLAAHEDTTSNQVAVLTMPSLNGETIEAFSIRVAEVWALGTAEKDNGVLLVVAVEDRALRIEVGYGLEGELPDVIAGRIIREEIVPYLREGNYERGIEAGVMAVLDRLESPAETPAAPEPLDLAETEPAPVAETSTPFWIDQWQMILIVYFLMALVLCSVTAALAMLEKTPGREIIFGLLLLGFFFIGRSFGYFILWFMPPWLVGVVFAGQYALLFWMLARRLKSDSAFKASWQRHLFLHGPDAETEEDSAEKTEETVAASPYPRRIQVVVLIAFTMQLALYLYTRWLSVIWLVIGAALAWFCLSRIAEDAARRKRRRSTTWTPFGVMPSGSSRSSSLRSSRSSRRSSWSSSSSSSWSSRSSSSYSSSSSSYSSSSSSSSSSFSGGGGSFGGGGASGSW